MNRTRLIFSLLKYVLILHRFTDFQVNEIGEDGKVLHLQVIGTLENKIEVFII